jgi:Cupin
MDPLSEVFGSMRIQDAICRRVEATAPWGVRYSGDKGLRVRFGLVIRGPGFLRFENQSRTIRSEPRSLLPTSPFVDRDWHIYLKPTIQSIGFAGSGISAC